MALAAIRALFFILVAALSVVAAVSWRRTLPLRRGHARPGLPRASGGPTSSATLLAGAAGSAALAWGGLAAARHRPASLLLLPGGAFVMVAGLVARVTDVRTDRVGISISYRMRATFSLPWQACRALVPPGSPLGGWRVMGDRGGRTLMPSDLFGREDVLEAIVHCAGLRFDGSSWRRPTSGSRGPPTRGGATRVP